MSTRINVGVFRQEKLRIPVMVIVSADQTQTVASPSNLQDRVVAGITRWVDTTAEGQKAWELSSQDFNIGDLSEWLDDVDLLKCLADEGVKNLTIESVDADTDWNYDTVLVDSNSLAE